MLLYRIFRFYQSFRRALEMGADDYFVKSQHPIEEVIEKVKEYLEARGKIKTAPAS